MSDSLLDLILGPDPQYWEGVRVIVVGAVGPLAVWIQDGEHDLAVDIILRALPGWLRRDAEQAGYQIGEEPVVVTTAWSMVPDRATGWPHPVYQGVVPEGALAEVFASAVKVEGM